MRLTQVDIAPLAADEQKSHAPDAHVEVADGQTLRARCSLWWRTVPSLDDHRLGLIGHYAAADAASGGRLLALACARLRGERCTLAVGPIDGSTWRRYRFVTDRVPAASRSRFFLEPDNPDAWPLHFQADGFRVLATYRSALATQLRQPTVAADNAFRDRGVIIRTLDAGDGEDLRRVYQASVASFAGNFLYTPISESEFVDQYRAVLPFVHPELVTIAELDGEIVGFLFAVPDILEASRTTACAGRTIVVKTLAVTPRCRGMGLGTLLFTKTNAAAMRMGFTGAIHALMHDGNTSQRISGDAHTIRRYALFARAL